MKIHLLSDLHLEFYHDPEHFMETLIQPADVLVLAGDIHVGLDNTARAVNFFANHYERVLYIPGNHEYYNRLELDAFDVYDDFEAKLAVNVTYLNYDYVKVGDVTFIGATLWTNFNDDPLVEIDASRCINDFRRIKTTPREMKLTNYDHRAYIKWAYEEFKGKKVIVTHFLPAMECVDPKYRNKDGITSNLNYYFANNLGSWIETLEDVTWLFGHTHDDVDVMIGQTRCLARPHGYPKERNFYTPLVLEI